MKSVRLLLLVVGMLAIAGIAEAQCYTCRNLRPMPPSQGVCVEGTPGLCSSQCCWQVYGTSCTVPDSVMYYCTWSGGGQLANNRYFTTAGPAQNNVVALTRKLGTLQMYDREVMKGRIPRRCPSAV